MKNKPDGFFSQEFKSLINGLLQLEPSHRPSMAEVMEHPWYKGETATEESAKEEMLMRKEQIEEQAELDRAEKQA
jgi:serine/threonine protein kinase